MAMTGYICFCPDLKLYHYHLTDDSKVGPDAEADYKFTEDELEDVVAAHLVQKNEKEAEFVAKITGLARHYPHKMVEFSSEGKMEIKEPKPEVEPA
jgi:hypothetical protein